MLLFENLWLNSLLSFAVVEPVRGVNQHFVLPDEVLFVATNNVCISGILGHRGMVHELGIFFRYDRTTFYLLAKYFPDLKDTWEQKSHFIGGWEDLVKKMARKIWPTCIHLSLSVSRKLARPANDLTPCRASIPSSTLRTPSKISLIQFFTIFSTFLMPSLKLDIR